MKKIPTVFERDFDNNPKLVLPQWHPDALWVRDGEGVATVKYDGTCALVRDGVLYKRHDRKLTKTAYKRREKGETGFTADDCKPAPEGWEPVQPAPDPNTGHWPGWLLVLDRPEDRWFREAWVVQQSLPDGTYELLGPKIQTNPYKLESHRFVAHGGDVVSYFPRTFEFMRLALETLLAEGIVFHRLDGSGQMAKIKRSDFGLPWPVPNPAPIVG